MPIWQIGLILLVAVWILQAAGTWFQMRHYRQVMGGIRGRWDDGYLGVGNARSSFGRGVILMLVVAADETVRELLVMEGRSVLAKFKPLPEFRGRSLDSLRVDETFNKQRGRAAALEQAIKQIDKARTRKDESTTEQVLQPA